MKKEAILRTVLASVAMIASGFLVGCESGGSGLECKDGHLQLDGHPFTSCTQCGNPSSCSFDTRTSYSYSSSGVIVSESGSTTASCDGQTATVYFSSATSPGTWCTQI
jgi:hypothetical protein